MTHIYQSHPRFLVKLYNVPQGEPHKSRRSALIHAALLNRLHERKVTLVVRVR